MMRPAVFRCTRALSVSYSHAPSFGLVAPPRRLLADRSRTVQDVANEAAKRGDGAANAVKHKAEEMKHKVKGEAAKEAAKDSDRPITERIKSGGEFIKEKAKEKVSQVQSEFDKQKAKGNTPK